jgi:hypothetical protein
MPKVEYKPAGANEWHEIEEAVLTDGRADAIILHPIDDPSEIERRRAVAREQLECELFQNEWDERLKKTRSALEESLAKIRSEREQKDRKLARSKLSTAIVEVFGVQLPREQPPKPRETFSDIMLDVFGEDLSKRRR